jgi:alpha-galactosidase
VILSINAGGSPSVGPWARQIANSWRVGGDICGSWYNMTRPPTASARGCYSRQYDEGLYDYLTSPGLRQQAALTGPGHYIDPDMLEVGIAPGPTGTRSPSGTGPAPAALTPAEARTNFAMWAMWSAPLLAGNDPRAMTGTDLASTVLLNRQLIAIDQDSLGQAARLESSPPGWQVWIKPLADGQIAAAMVNLDSTPLTATFTWQQLGLSVPPVVVRDAWANRTIAVNPRGLEVQVAPHGTAVYELTLRRSHRPAG